MKSAVSASDARKAYMREWRKRNKEKVKQYNENYWLRQAEKMNVGANRKEVQPHE